MSQIGITKTFDFGDGKEITVETGKLAKQAHGSCVVRMGDTMILATVVSSYDARPGVDFLPLSVDYQEKFAAVGRIPGSFLRRESRLSDYEVLISRIVDRALRPLFPEDYHADIQVMLSLISSDQNILPDCLVGFAASMAVMLSDIPFNGPISECRVGRIDGKFIINPTKEELEKSDIDLIIAGTEHDLNMVEGEMDEISEDEMVEAMRFGHDHIKKQIAGQLEFLQLAGGRKPAREYNHENNKPELSEQVKKDLYEKVMGIATSGQGKNERRDAFKALVDEYITGIAEITEDDKALVKKYYHHVEYDVMRDMVINQKRRLDGRGTEDVRPIWCEVGYLPSAHGSAIFTRGETQSLTTVTLGTKLDEQLLDSPMKHGTSRFMLHYNFPSFSTGEVKPNRAPGRREIGHGNLAQRGIEKMMPNEMENPYTIRIVSDVLESNGSSSMATVCAASLALMDAGVKIKKQVSGIAMGLISDEESGKYVILSDILGDEDHLGDMDFKVVGTEKGIVACQMDIKINGLKWNMVSEALAQAKRGRLHILNEMNKAIQQPNSDYKPHAPRIEKIEIDQEFIGAVIGPGGKIIQGIQKETGTTISITEVGNKGIVEIASNDRPSLDRAMAIVKGIVSVPEPGEEYEGTVKGITDFGAFVEFMPGKEGLLHISEISWKRLPSMEGVLQVGEQLKVKLLEVDKKTGKYRLSRKALLPKPEGMEDEPRERGERGDRGDRGDRRGPRDGNREHRGERRDHGDRREHGGDRGERRERPHGQNNNNGERRQPRSENENERRNENQGSNEGNRPVEAPEGNHE